MAAPKGNNFWELRLKHGRSHAIETADELWQNYLEYAKWLQGNPLIEVDFYGKDATQIEKPKMRPQTKEGFALACGLSGWEVISAWKKREGFIEVISRIEKNILIQKFEGAAANLLNPNIIAREIGLKEHSEQSGETTIRVIYDDTENS